jgi:hypothetical protein
MQLTRNTLRGFTPHLDPVAFSLAVPQCEGQIMRVMALCAISDSRAFQHPDPLTRSEVAESSRGPQREAPRTEVHSRSRNCQIVVELFVLRAESITFPQSQKNPLWRLPFLFAG